MRRKEKEPRKLEVDTTQLNETLVNAGTLLKDLKLTIDALVKSTENAKVAAQALNKAADRANRTRPRPIIKNSGR